MEINLSKSLSEMEKHYIQLNDGKEVRILWDKHSEYLFTELTGKKMQVFVDGHASMEEILCLAWCAASEGEKADGRILELNEKQFGRLLNNDAAIKIHQMLIDIAISKN